MTLTRPLLSLTALTAAAVLSACGAGADTGTDAGSSSGAFPVTVENCGSDVTFEAAPERTVLLKSAAVPYLHDLGVLDRVTARAGQYPEDYYDQETLAELDEIPLLTDETDTSGHLQINKEIVIAERPDLVLGEVDNLSRDTLAAVDIPLLEEPALCSSDGSARPTYDDISAQMRMYGEVFDRSEEAETAVTALENRLADIEAEVGDGSGQTAAVLYPTVGGGVTYAYGTGSMAQPQLDAAGLENVYADVEERVFEVSLEELLGRDPDVIVLLYSDGDPAEVEAALTDLPGAGQLTAVRNGDVMTQLFNFTEPPSPLAVDGLERIVERFGAPAGTGS